MCVCVCYYVVKMCDYVVEVCVIMSWRCVFDNAVEVSVCVIM